jgi:hypothetical protein
MSLRTLSPSLSQYWAEFSFRLIKDEELGLSQLLRAEGQLLLLPTRKVAAVAATHFLQYRELPAAILSH